LLPTESRIYCTLRVADEGHARGSKTAVKMPRIILVEGTLNQHAEMVEREAKAGNRVGWLDMAADETNDNNCAGAKRVDIFRAVEVGSRTTLAYKPRHGPAVLKDLIREYFLGCSVVLVRAAAGSENGDTEASSME